jgi:hypothetical protein
LNKVGLLALKVDLAKSFKSYVPLLVAFVVIVSLSLVTTELVENNSNLLMNLAVSPGHPWGIVTALFANYNMEYAFSNIVGLSVYFVLFCLANAFLLREGKSKRYLFFSITIFVAGILANIFFLVTGFLVLSLQGASIGTSPIVYGVEGSAFTFAVINFLSLKKIMKKRLIYFYLWLANPFIILLSSLDLYIQLSRATSFFVYNQVNIFVHYYAFASGLMITLIWFLLTNIQTFKNPTKKDRKM